MPTIDSCQLTSKDYTILEVMQERRPGGDTFSAILQRKISGAVVMFREDIPATVVTLSTRVAYRVNDGPAETRIVAHDEMRGLVGMLLPITTRAAWRCLVWPKVSPCPFQPRTAALKR
jgi:regulator of nucleoside diphosphate kinase